MVNQVPVNTIEITEKAANKVKTFAEQDGKSNFALRVAVKGGGCSGLTYDLEITDKDASSDEKIIIQHDVEVRVPKKSFIFLAGTTLDFSDVVEDKRVFHFIEYIKASSEDNWIFQFQNVNDIKETIIAQFAYYLFLFPRIVKNPPAKKKVWTHQSLPLFSFHPI